MVLPSKRFVSLFPWSNRCVAICSFSFLFFHFQQLNITKIHTQRRQDRKTELIYKFYTYLGQDIDVIILNYKLTSHSISCRKGTDKFIWHGTELLKSSISEINHYCCHQMYITTKFIIKSILSSYDFVILIVNKIKMLNIIKSKLKDSYQSER